MPPDKNRDKKLLDLENLSVSKSKEIHQQERTHQNIGSKIHKQKNKDQLSSSGDEWITPKKPFKSTERTKVEFYPSFMEVGRPDLDSSKTSQSPIEVIQGPKDTIRPLQHKKKSKSKGKQKVRAVSADEDNWDLETPEAKPANPTGLNDPEHEDFIKYVQEKLQNYFVSVNDSEGARISLNSLEKPSVRMILEQFLDIDDPTPLLKLELEPRAFEILYGCEKMHPDIYKSDYWNFEIDHILKPLDSVHDEEWMRRKGAFFSQYFKTRESRKFEEHGKSLDVNLREIAKLVNVGSPFETFVEETEDHINALMDLVNSMDQSEFEKLGETFSIDFFYPRFFMVDLRLLELNNLRSDSFFGKEFLQNAMKQGLKIYSIRLLEIALELSSPVVTWKELSQDVIQTKYIQVLSVLADAPCLRPGISKVSLSEAELHSRNGRWIGSLTQKVLMNDPQLWDYVLKRIKLLLSTLKGRGARTLREMAGEKYTHSAYENELIFYDEAFAASFVGLSLFDVARLKNYQRGLRNSPSSKGRNHKNRVYWPKLSSKAVPQFEAFKKYYQLLGQILLLEK
ncbi:hypothetical protein DFH28DRAFT_630843 [Melampsora americana]|nr:hypothetical protein DFH28DRAFT_630843 [Melampsora americana]